MYQQPNDYPREPIHLTMTETTHQQHFTCLSSQLLVALFLLSLPRESILPLYSPPPFSFFFYSAIRPHNLIDLLSIQPRRRPSLSISPVSSVGGGCAITELLSSTVAVTSTSSQFNCCCYSLMKNRTETLFSPGILLC